MRHVFGVLGVAAAAVLLAVSAAMNWRFGYTLGRTELDGQIYGAASAAADCLKALVPFFFFAALRNRMWSQAVAAFVVGIVVTGYSLTSALGHAMLNRGDTTGDRAMLAQKYADLRADMKRAQEQLSWVPQHRPAATVQSEIEGIKGQRQWKWTNGCADVKGRDLEKFCQSYHALTGELAAAQSKVDLESRIAATKAQLDKVSSSGAMSEADPQAAALTKLGALAIPGLKVEDVQTALAVFVALLLEIGSGFGMYVAFSTWRLYDRAAPAAPVFQPSSSQLAPAMATAAPRSLGANDNKSMPKLQAPDSDVERYYRDRITTSEGSSLTATALYEDYCAWCEEQEKEPLALPTFGREFGDLGVQKAKIAGRVRYIGVKLNSGVVEHEEDRKTTASLVQAA